ncbi:hypothetical protein M8818_005382 [Zalaria obscura]|uniref:Uncharacterized protein n=1 Tax=Zalaria obscura TaxID=2024903 RepID=A0ACC3SC59_9PEZI
MVEGHWSQSAAIRRASWPRGFRTSVISHVVSECTHTELSTRSVMASQTEAASKAAPQCTKRVRVSLDGFSYQPGIVVQIHCRQPGRQDSTGA